MQSRLPWLRSLFSPTTLPPPLTLRVVLQIYVLYWCADKQQQKNQSQPIRNIKPSTWSQLLSLHDSWSYVGDTEKMFKYYLKKSITNLYVTVEIKPDACLHCCRWSDLQEFFWYHYCMFWTSMCVSASLWNMFPQPKSLSHTELSSGREGMKGEMSLIVNLS